MNLYFQEINNLKRLIKKQLLSYYCYKKSKDIEKGLKVFYNRSSNLLDDVLGSLELAKLDELICKYVHYKHGLYVFDKDVLTLIHMILLIRKPLCVTLAYLAHDLDYNIFELVDLLNF